MLFIGIDPGLVKTGVGVIRKQPRVSHTGNGFEMIHVELLKPPKKSLEKRLLYIHDHLLDILRNHPADVMAVEDQFFGENAQTAFKTGQARGAALLAAARQDIPVILLPPARIKQAVVGNGRASKEQVRHMISQILNLRTAPASLDCTDALAAALCCAFSPEYHNI